MEPVERLTDENTIGPSHAAIAATLDDDIDADSLQLRIGETSHAVAMYARLPEDEGIRLKTTACMNAWYALEGMTRMASEYVREGVVRQQVSLKQLIRDGKALLEEISLRVKVHDAAMACHESAFRTAAAPTDLDKFHTYCRLRAAIKELAQVLEPIPARFKAAHRDLHQARAVFAEFSAEWKEDLVQRLSHRPHWVPDEFSRRCSRCQKPFTLLRTRHHCRSCGLIFCDSCSVILPSLPKLVYFTSQRVCLGCEKNHVPCTSTNQQHLQHHLETVFPDLII